MIVKIQTATKKTNAKSQKKKSPLSVYVMQGVGLPIRVQKKCACGGGCPRCDDAKIQAKLNIGQSGDVFEQEADRIADEVVQTKSISVSDLKKQSGKKNTQQPTNPFTQKITPIAQRQLENDDEEKEELLQTKSNMQSKIEMDEERTKQIHTLFGAGQVIPATERHFFESHFGVNFQPVRLHTDGHAQQLARRLQAKAFTVGKDIAFASGEYNPRSFAGKKLLAHELTHVVQQGAAAVNRLQRTIDDGHDLRSYRFKGNERLEQAFDVGEPNIGYGETGLHVRILQQALLDAGQSLPVYGVDGIFKSETRGAVRGFQIAQGLTGAAVTGVVDEITMNFLDSYFMDRAHDAATAIGQGGGAAPTPGTPFARGSAPVELMRGTRPLDPADLTAIERTRTTEVQAPSGGSLPTFHPTIATPTMPRGVPPACAGALLPDYGPRVEAATRCIINRQHTSIGVPAANRVANPAAVYSWSLIHRITDASKAETDRVFGAYAVGNPMRHGVNLGDAWERKRAQYAAGGAAYEQGRVEWRVRKILDGPAIGGINRQHGVVASREQAILDGISRRLVADPPVRQKLKEIDWGWPAFADPATGTVYLQRLRGNTPLANKLNLWDIFQTTVHEYIHTLAHPDYRTYYASLPEQRGGRTYREGMTEYFTHMVLGSTNYSNALRATIEDSYYQPADITPIPTYRGYEERHNAEAVIGIAGIRNAMAAFFLGEIQLIGG